MNRCIQSIRTAALFLLVGSISNVAYAQCACCGPGGCVSNAFPGGESSPTGNVIIPQLTLDANGLPILNSNPNAIGSAYIDFDGGYWGNPNNPLAGYSTDSDGSTFNISEQEDIYKAWLDVATHFAMFDINVTTVAPDKAVTPTAHLLISNDRSGNGGAANTNVFGSTGASANGVVGASATRGRSTAMTHELGHMMGLTHQAEFDEDGNFVRAYSPADEWNKGFLMGSDPLGKFSAWQDGTRRHSDGMGGYVPGPQNDIQIISDKIIEEYNAFTGDTYTGDGFREDDHGLGRHGSTHIGNGPQDVFAEGIIERYDDEDGFKFKWFGGDFHAFVEGDRNATASPEFASSLGMNLILELRNGTFIDSDLSSDPADTDAELVITDLASGQYILKVSGAGEDDDLGTYNLWVNPAQLPNGTTAPLTSMAVFGGPEGAGDVLFAAVPEPSSLALLGIGGLMMIRRRRGESRNR